MGPPDLDNVGKLLALLSESSEECGQAGEEPSVDLSGHCHVHGSGERVVGALAPVHVVVWMDRVLGTQLPSQQLNGPTISNIVIMQS